jgi:hypothetical protein
MDATPHGGVGAVTATAATPLFVLGGHRGGTTLVQRLLNSYDDVAIWGEHEGVLTQIADAYFRGVESKALFADVRPPGASDPRRDWQAWMSAVGAEDWDASFRRLVTSLFRPDHGAPVRHWGFKEIRYGTTPDDRAIELLARLFPDARVVFIVRNPFNMLASAHSRPEGPRSLGDVVRVCGRIAARFESFRDWHASGGCEPLDRLRGARARGGDVHALVADLGHTIGRRRRDVIAAEGGGRGSSFHDAAVNERWRRLPAAWLAVARERLGRSRPRSATSAPGLAALAARRSVAPAPSVIERAA